MAAGFASGACGVGRQDSGEAGERMRQAIITVEPPLPAGEDREPDPRIANHRVSMLHQAPSHFVTGLTVDDVDPSRPRERNDGKCAQEKAREGQTPSRHLRLIRKPGFATSVLSTLEHAGDVAMDARLLVCRPLHEGIVLTCGTVHCNACVAWALSVSRMFFLPQSAWGF